MASKFGLHGVLVRFSVGKTKQGIMERISCGVRRLYIVVSLDALINPQEDSHVTTKPLSPQLNLIEA